MMRTYFDDFNADFTCKHCGQFVSARTAISGVVNRNHCPYCLHSRHGDLFEAGDRLCACKGLMAPVGLTVKRSRDKYANDAQGELMLVHRCKECGDLSINRIAADDDPVRILALLDTCAEYSDSLYKDCKVQGIHLLSAEDRPRVETQLYGESISLGRFV
jgi:predicted RNA-binding Zn-ribbon protein involved in translation (DUF1610 family)